MATPPTGYPFVSKRGVDVLSKLKHTLPRLETSVAVALLTDPNPGQDMQLCNMIIPSKE